MSKNKGWFDRNQDNMPAWSDMTTRRRLFQCATIIKIQLSELVLYKVDIITNALNLPCSRHEIAEKLFIWG